MKKSKIIAKEVSSFDDNAITLYHGSSVEVKKPQFGYGSDDNDYGSGFYLTQYYDRAVLIVL